MSSPIYFHDGLQNQIGSCHAKQSAVYYPVLNIRSLTAVEVFTSHEQERANNDVQEASNEVDVQLGSSVEDVSHGTEVSPKTEKHSIPCLGVLLTVVSALSFSFSSLAVALLQNLHPLQIGFFRCIFQALLLLPLIIFHRMLLLYCTVRTIGLAEGILLSRLSPAITILFAWPVLGERWRRSDPPLLILAIVGVLLVVRPRSIFGSYADDQVENTSLHWQGTIMGIAAAVASSFTILVLRRLGGRKISVVLITWAYAVVGLVGSVIALLIVGGISERDGSSYPLTVIPNCGRDRWLVIATGVFGVCGQTLLAKALQLEDAGPVSIARSVDVAFAFLWHVTVLQLPLSFWSLGGAACITLCTSGLALRAFRSRNNPQK
uniref:solute carrier family 35 member G1 isoform X2 n=1 Tax=Myxine glutinosa TaxID=7769 RepID=UPI00358DE865